MEQFEILQNPMEQFDTDVVLFQHRIRAHSTRVGCGVFLTSSLRSLAARGQKNTPAVAGVVVRVNQAFGNIALTASSTFRLLAFHCSATTASRTSLRSATNDSCASLVSALTCDAIALCKT